MQLRIFACAIISSVVAFAQNPVAADSRLAVYAPLAAAHKLYRVTPLHRVQSDERRGFTHDSNAIRTDKGRAALTR
jgi:hypothetical protein